MSQSNEEDQQCFIPAHWEEGPIDSNREQDFLYLNINRLLEEAKQLHNRARPQTLQPRTCFLELPFKKLPQYLEQPCIEVQPQQNQSGPFTPIDNPDHIPLASFFQDHEIIYNKMKMYSRPNFQLTEPMCRFKPISQLFDFHEKLFKQLYANQAIKSPTHVAINDEFDSAFQSGNLGLVFKKEDTLEREYFLVLENDVNSHGYTSWFFFKVKSCGRGRAFFHIVNLSKSPYLYKIGLKISVFSVGKYNESKTGWFKGGKNIQTYSTNFQKKSGGGDTYSSLYFEYDFEQNQSQVYFSMSKPYTYSMLTRQLQQMEAKLADSGAQFQLAKSIYTITCNIIPIVVLSQGGQSEDFVTVDELNLPVEKKVVVFMARQHPGEVVGSYYMSKVMEAFTRDTKEIKQLLKQYTIIFIPMVNPDGVIHGNSRCNFSGLDLNRQWMKQCSKEVTPQTHYLRKFLWQVHENVGIEYVIDLHGHSKKMNSFFFCNKLADKYPSEYLPCIVSKINKRFDLSSCTFNTTPDKKNTLRNQLFEKGMKNCVTVQNSYFGYWEDKTAKLFKEEDYFQMADSLIKALYFVLMEDPESCKAFIESFGVTREELINQVKIYKESNAKKIAGKIIENNDIESESDPEADIMEPEQMLKIYEKQAEGRKKEPERKKSRVRKPRQPKIDKDDEIRASEPMKMYKDIPTVQTKAHKSQKKLQAMVNNKKSVTQQKFREKPILIPQKKKSFKREEVIRQKVLSMNNEDELEGFKETTKDMKSRKIFGVPFPKQNYETFLTKANNKSRLIQTRFRTDVETSKVRVGIEKDATSYGKIKEESIKIFLNETLSISKVNNHQSNTYITNGLNEMKGRKESLKPERFIEKTKRVQTQNRSQSKMELEIDNNCSGISIAKERQERKKFLSRNYKKELVRRKKILSTHDQAKKYKRFENFMASEDEKDGRKTVKPECNSVFYYFPVL